MKRIAVIDGHPDAGHTHLDHALADLYVKVVRDLGCEVRRINVAKLAFPFLSNPEEFVNAPAPVAIRDAQEDIAWADHLAFVYPMWISDMPALLKAFIEQTFRPGFAMDYGGKGRFPKALLKGKSARLIVTMGMPAPIYRWLFGRHMIKSYRLALNMCGIRPVVETLIGGVGESAPESVTQKWFDEIERAAKVDSVAVPKWRMTFLRTAARTATLASAAYLGYAAVSWIRYGNIKRAKTYDALLNGVMPEYEVGVRHRITVNAPLDITYDTIRDTEIERSPIVRALFRTREIVLKAKRVEQRLPHALVEEMAALGWTVLAEEQGREIVLGTATQPWKPNPVFRSMHPTKFADFTEPGHAKIAFSLRVDPVGEDRCEASTETRVQTTDAGSRALFRSYWAFLSPGVDVIRRVLLQQIKAEAEARYNALTASETH